MIVDILVEIGTPEQQQLIKDELLMILSWLGEDFIAFTDLHQIIVPADFDATVNRLQDITWYTSDRINLCIGKVIEREGRHYIIISQYMYTTPVITFGKRCHFLFHEINHLDNRKNFVIPEFDWTAESRYTNMIAIMFDEYSANLKANEMMLVLEKYEIFGDVKKQLTDEYNGFLAPIKGETDYYVKIKVVYQAFLEDYDAAKMVRDAYIFFDPAVKEVAYTYSYADSYPPLMEDFKQQESLFLNEATEDLFNLFRQWYSSEDAIDFTDGLDAARSFVAACFGISFFEGEQGERFNFLPY